MGTARKEMLGKRVWRVGRQMHTNQEGIGIGGGAERPTGGETWNTFVSHSGGLPEEA